MKPQYEIKSIKKIKIEEKKEALRILVHVKKGDPLDVVPVILDIVLNNYVDFDIDLELLTSKEMKIDKWEPEETANIYLITTKLLPRLLAQ